VVVNRNPGIAAIGLAIRTVGAGGNVFIGQFLKKSAILAFNKTLRV
jgi:ATP:corrinoid adenosyltransferase